MKLLLDYLVEMHEQFLLEMIRHTKHSCLEKSKKAKRQVRQGVSVLTDAVGYLLEEAKTKANPENKEKLNLTPTEAQSILTEFFHKFGTEGLSQAVNNCHEWQAIEEQGYLQEIRNYFSGLGKYFYRFSELPFKTVSGSEYLLEALEIVRKLNRREIKDIPETAAIKFVPPVWRKGLYLKKSKNRTIIDRRLWLAALALAVRDALRSGTLYLPDSRRYVSFWNLVYQENEWQRERDISYQMLSLEQDTVNLFASLKREFNEVLENFSHTLPNNKFVALENGKLKLKREDALPLPEKTKKLRKVIKSAMPRVRIEDLLAKVDVWTEFSANLRPPPEMRERSLNLKKTKLAALIAHVVLKRLINATPADHISKALTQLGRLIKSIFILKYLGDEKMRRKIQKQLNRGEQRHGLGKWMFFANHGEFRTGDYEEIMNKVSCLSILSNAALIWNTIEIGKILNN